MEEIDYLTPDPKYKDHPMDLVFANRVREIVKEYGITTIVETGVDLATSAMTLTRIADRYIGIEILQKSVDLANQRFAENNITNAQIIKGNSPVVLLSIMHQLDVDKTLFFLDAHWGPYWPLLDEIDTISRGKGIIIMHDFEIPGHPELGFDTQMSGPEKGKILNYDYVKQALTRWSPTHRIEYNSEALHVMPRGLCYAFPR
jgi:predicted O-methyltransferase YrrM